MSIDWPIARTCFLLVMLAGVPSWAAEAETPAQDAPPLGTESQTVAEPLLLLPEAASELEANPKPVEAKPPAPKPPESKRPVLVPTKPITVQVTAEVKGWMCRIDDTPPLAPDSSGVLVAQLPPGEYLLTCLHPSFAPYAKQIRGESGETVTAFATFQSKGEAPPPPVVETPAEVSPPPPPKAFDFILSGGFAPGHGLFGIGVGARLGRWGLSFGTGAYPFAASLQHYFGAGRTGFYLNAGYLRVGQSLFTGGSDSVSGHELFATGGLDIRLLSKLGVRIGLGAGYKLGMPQRADGRGPVVFDFSVLYAL